MRSLLIAALALMLAAPAAAAGWVTYENDRYGTRLEIPIDIFRPLPPPENGDGRQFVTSDQLASVTVFAAPNADGRTIDELYRTAMTEADGERITYERKARRWFVVSGFRGDDVFYRKLILSPDGQVAHTLELVYPAEEKPFFDPLTTRIANSMSGP